MEIKAGQGNWFRANSFELSATYWNRKSNNVIYPVSVAPSTGGTTIKTNAIDLASHGVQASLISHVYKDKSFDWNFTANFSHATTIITKITYSPIVTVTQIGYTQEELIAGQENWPDIKH